MRGKIVCQNVGYFFTLVSTLELLHAILWKKVQNDAVSTVLPGLQNPNQFKFSGGGPLVPTGQVP